MTGGSLVTTLTDSTNRWRYSGKEEQEAINPALPLIDYGARMYDPTIARWMSVDPLAEKYYPVGPYIYCAGNPVRFIDPDGKIIRDTKGNIVYVTNGDRNIFDHKSGLSVTLEIGYVFADDGTPVQVLKNIDSNACWDTNCHGTSFTDGRFWLNNDQVPTLLEGDGYKIIEIEKAKVGDIIVYNGDSNSEHSMTIIKTDGTMKGTEVYGQGGTDVENHTDKASEAWHNPQNSTVFRKENPDKVATDEEIKKLRRRIYNE